MIIFVTGSESTGKTTLAKGLAEYYQKEWAPEYAREYIENLGRVYNYQDIETIALKQIRDIESWVDRDLIFADTGLIITKVWFEKKFGKVPKWFSDVYESLSLGHYLVCQNDLPWKFDPVRENPNIREELNYLYELELKQLKHPYLRISGQEERRLLNAVKQVDKWLKEENSYEN